MKLFVSHQQPHLPGVSSRNRVFFIPGDVADAFAAFDAKEPGCLVMPPKGWAGRIVWNQEEWDRPLEFWQDGIAKISKRYPDAELGFYGWPQPSTLEHIVVQVPNLLWRRSDFNAPSFRLDNDDVSWMPEFVACAGNACLPILEHRYGSGKDRYLAGLDVAAIWRQVGEMKRLGVQEFCLWLDGEPDWHRRKFQQRNGTQPHDTECDRARIVFSDDCLPNPEAIPSAVQRACEAAVRCYQAAAKYA